MEIRNPTFSKYLLLVNNWKIASWLPCLLGVGSYFNAFSCDDDDFDDHMVGHLAVLLSRHPAVLPGQ